MFNKIKRMFTMLKELIPSSLSLSNVIRPCYLAIEHFDCVSNSIVILYQIL